MQHPHGLRYSKNSEQPKRKEMQTVTHAVVQEVINNTGLSWRDAVAWCDNNLLPQWRTRPQQQAVKLTTESDSNE